MTITVNENISLQLIEEHHAEQIFNLVHHNRAHLREWLPFVDSMQSVEFAQGFVKATMHRNSQGIEFAFIIMENKQAIGRIGVYKIDAQNKIGEIGYWIIENKQGKGIITQSCKALIDFCFNELQLNRIEIRCGVGNNKSKAIPEKLQFQHEGIIRQGEWVHDKFVDLHLYSTLKLNTIRL